MSELFEIAKAAATSQANALRAGMATADFEVLRLKARIAQLERINKRMSDSLTEIEQHAQDKYDGPEDKTHGPYLAEAQRGLGIIP